MNHNTAETLPNNLVAVCCQYEFLELLDFLSVHLGFGPSPEFQGVSPLPGYHQYTSNPQYLSISSPYIIAVKKVHPGSLSQFMKVNVETQQLPHLQALMGGGTRPQRQPRNNSHNSGLPYDRHVRGRGCYTEDSGETIPSPGLLTPSFMSTPPTDANLIRKLFEKITYSLNSQLGENITSLFGHPSATTGDQLAANPAVSEPAPASAPMLMGTTPVAGTLTAEQAA
ncbi:hypothetical protein FRC04_003771, partial [Tulasnella sp. 424]